MALTVTFTAPTGGQLKGRQEAALVTATLDTVALTARWLSFVLGRAAEITQGARIIRRPSSARATQDITEISPSGARQPAPVAMLESGQALLRKLAKVVTRVDTAPKKKQRLRRRVKCARQGSTLRFWPLVIAMTVHLANSTTTRKVQKITTPRMTACPAPRANSRTLQEVLSASLVNLENYQALTPVSAPNVQLVLRAVKTEHRRRVYQDSTVPAIASAKNARSAIR